MSSGTGAAESVGRSAILGDLLAGLTLAAIAIPEQMATAKLGGFPPELGFVAFLAGSVGFFLLGANRYVSVGADSTITPIFAAALAAAAAGSVGARPEAAALALMVGALVAAAGLLRMGWIADLLSAPVTIGFLAGIAVHIIASQLPGALGVAPGAGSTLRKLAAVAREAPGLSPATLAIAAGVLALTAFGHRLSARIPAPLIALVLAALAVRIWRLDAHGVAVLGQVHGGLKLPSLPAIPAAGWLKLAPLALLIALVVIVQTAATTRAFPPEPDTPPRLDRDFLGVGAGALLAGLMGAFPVNASPPRTAAVAESGGRSKAAGLLAAALVAVVLLVGTGLLTRVPQAALSGILLFIALRIIRFGEAISVARSSLAEFALILATATAIIMLPIATGVAVGVGLSLLYGIWSNARPRTYRLQRLPGTTVWWPSAPERPGETVPGVIVVGFQAPLSFINADIFRRQLRSALAEKPRLVVLEAAGIVDIDFTGGEALGDVIGEYRRAHVALAISRLESVEAQRALDRLGLKQALGADRIFPSVQEAIDALAPVRPGT